MQDQKISPFFFLLNVGFYLISDRSLFRLFVFYTLLFRLVICTSTAQTVQYDTIWSKKQFTSNDSQFSTSPSFTLISTDKILIDFSSNVFLTISPGVTSSQSYDTILVYLKTENLNNKTTGYSKVINYHSTTSGHHYSSNFDYTTDNLISGTYKNSVNISVGCFNCFLTSNSTFQPVILHANEQIGNYPNLNYDSFSSFAYNFCSSTDNFYDCYNNQQYYPLNAFYDQYFYITGVYMIGIKWSQVTRVEDQQTKDKSLVNSYDIFGRAVGTGYQGLVFRVYDDGSVVKEWLE